MSNGRKKRFPVNTIVKVPIQVCESLKARIVSVEYGPDNRYLEQKYRGGWVYTLREIKQDGTEAGHLEREGLGFLATERELSQWQRGLG